jgi:hypothetical protein
MELARRLAGKKFMWDSQVHADEKEAKEAARKYEADGFLTELVNEDNQFYVFTRREMKASATEAKST